ncbi:MAG: excinuclease ABC subunit UvrC, partial [Gemmiger sp.]
MTKPELYKKAQMLPLLPGVYIIRDKSDEIIYIGKAKRLRTRVSQYFREGVPHDAKVTQMIAHAFSFDVIVCQSEFEALVLEASQIKAHTPKYNILLKDDKGYSYVKITRGDWPRISAALQKDDENADYIGPFTSSFAVREMVETAQNCFLLPRCNKEFPRDIGKGRPCLNAHIGKCMAVCSGKIRREAYQDAVNGALHMIRYGKKDIVKQLREKMQAASDRLDFETAALLRDQIAAIEHVSPGQKVVMDESTEMDVVAFAGTSNAVCAAILRYRDGRLADKREFLFRETADISAVREEFLPQYYLNGEQVPRTVAVDALPEDHDALSQALAEARGSKVELYVPQRGDVAKLVTMAYTNAVERLGRESGRFTREQKLLEECAQVLGLKHPPRVIESYDISNWGDGTSVCGMVVFQDGKPFRSGYRRFKMRTVAGTDDYASMAESLSRRAGEYAMARRGEKPDTPGNQFSVLPDLILLDGGRGQVSAVRAA